MALPTQSSVVSEKQATASPAAQTLEATYTRPYMAHASIGPSCAVAQFKDGSLTVYHSQSVFPLRRDIPRALKLDVGAVRCVHAEGAGCCGTTAPTRWPSMPHCWLVRFPNGRCAYNGCATTSLLGSHMARR